MAKYMDYDERPEGAGAGKFLNLKAKGDKVTIRLADKPMSYFVHWLDNKPVICENKETCQQCVILGGFTPEEMKKKENAQLRRRQTFIWPVIDREDGEAKIFKGGINIFLAVGEFALDEKWGGKDKDATLFDVTITRTETSLQNFYSVVPDPTSLGVEITKEEKEKIAKLAPLIDGIVAGATTEEIAEDTEPEKPSTENPATQGDFIKGLEEDKEKV